MNSFSALGREDGGGDDGAFNRRFERWLDEEHDERFKAAAAASGSHSRLEKSGKSLLRAMSKLVHSGFGAYEKGDGGDVKDLMRKLKSAWSEEAIVRVELSKRRRSFPS